MLMCVRCFLCQIFFLLILQSGWELLTASCRIFCTAVMTFNCAELPQTPVLWAVIPYIKDEREHDSFPFSPILASLLCYLVPGGWYIRTYIHTHTHLYTHQHTEQLHTGALYTLKASCSTNHSQPYNGEISPEPVNEQRQKPGVTDLLGSFPQVWGAWDEMAALCPLHFREKKECFRSTAPHTCLVQPLSSLGQPEPSAPASPILSYFCNHNFLLKKS